MNEPAQTDTAYYLRRLVDHSPSMLGYWDRDLRCRFANQTYERWFGARPGALIGASMPELLGPELFARNEAEIRGALAGVEQTFERLVPGPGGRKVHSQAHYLPDVVDGKVVGFMVEVRDVTRRKEAETALRAEMAERERAHELLRQNESSLREAQRLGQIGSWEWDIATDTTTWSDELYQIFGHDRTLPAPSYGERRQARYHSARDWAALQAAVERTLRTGEPFALETEYTRPDGHSGWIEARGEAVRDAAGQIVKLRGTALEITTRRQMQEARLQRDLAEAASHNKTQFLSRVSHELRTPLNAVLGFAQLCELDTTLPEKHRAWAAVIRSSGQHMLDLIEDILDLSSAEMGQMRVETTRMDLAEVVRVCLTQLSQQAERAQVQLVDQLPHDTPLLLRADPRRVRQVIHNLVSNALKYSRPGDRVTLQAKPSGGSILLRVEDTGIGMSAAQLERLFTPFDRLGAETTAVQGSGIGLALTRKLVELMDGQIEVQSQPGHGSVFTVRLPAALPSATPPPTSPPPQSAA
ncbi:MAG: PAS domain-containing protein [Rhizobacter sp.]|nr:PAS domain-containing protein [Rhizobacter sp.]